LSERQASDDPLARLPILLPDARRTAEDAPSGLERFLASRVVQYGTGAAGVGALVGFGLGAEWVVTLGAVIAGGPRLALALMFGRHFRRGLYRRSLFVTTRLLELSWWWRDSFIWRLNQATCYMALGDLEKGKALACQLREKGLPSYAGWAVYVNLAALYLKLGEAESALAVLEGVPLGSVPDYGQVHYLLNRAGAQALQCNWAAALDDLESAEALGPGPELRAGCLSLRAYVMMENGGDREGALFLSNEAVHLLGERYRVQAGVLVAHARIVLDATQNVGACLEILSRVVEHEPELGLPDQAELHFLFARCCASSGLDADALAHVDRAADLPSRSPLRERILDLQARLSPIAA
jgi:tetratricopeptide (TPR) repeat protein